MVGGAWPFSHELLPRAPRQGSVWKCLILRGFQIPFLHVRLPLVCFWGSEVERGLGCQVPEAQLWQGPSCPSSCHFLDLNHVVFPGVWPAAGAFLFQKAAAPLWPVLAVPPAEQLASGSQREERMLVRLSVCL